MILAHVRYVPAEVEARAVARGDVLGGYRVREVVAWEQDDVQLVDIITTGGARTLAPTERVTVQRRVVERM